MAQHLKVKEGFVYEDISIQQISFKTLSLSISFGELFNI